MHTREQAAEQGIESDVLLADEEVNSSILSICDLSVRWPTEQLMQHRQSLPFEENSVDLFIRYDSLRILLANCSVDFCRAVDTANPPLSFQQLDVDALAQPPP